MTSSTLFLLILLMRVAHFWDILTSIFTDGNFKINLNNNTFLNGKTCNEQQL